jgi:hypothetical protein
MVCKTSKYNITCLLLIDEEKTEREKREIDKLMRELTSIVNKRDELEQQFSNVENE